MAYSNDSAIADAQTQSHWDTAATFRKVYNRTS